MTHGLTYVTFQIEFKWWSVRGTAPNISYPFWVSQMLCRSVSGAWLDDSGTGWLPKFRKRQQCESSPPTCWVTEHYFFWGYEVSETPSLKQKWGHFLLAWFSAACVGALAYEHIAKCTNRITYTNRKTRELRSLQHHIKIENLECSKLIYHQTSKHLWWLNAQNAKLGIWIPDGWHILTCQCQKHPAEAVRTSHDLSWPWKIRKFADVFPDFSVKKKMIFWWIFPLTDTITTITRG